MTSECLNCGISENEMPLIHLQYKSKQVFICSRCLPTLIHNPAKLADRLEGSEHFPAADHKH